MCKDPNSGARGGIPVDGHEMEVDADASAYDVLSQHPRIADLAAMARTLMTASLDTRSFEPLPQRVVALSTDLALTRDEAATPFGNAVDVLGRGPQSDAERALACGLAAHVVRLHPPHAREDEDRLATDLLWLAWHTPFDATGLLDRALGDNAGNLWSAIAERIRLIDQRKLTSLGRGEALLAGAALASSRSKVAATAAAALAHEVSDRKLARVLYMGDQGEGGTELTGEMRAAPRGPAVTALLAFTGVLLCLCVARVFAVLVLSYKRPADVRIVEDGGLRVHWRTEILGRTLRDQTIVVPRSALAQITRDVRYPRAAFYSGLLALAVGSCLGVSALVDGLRAASPSLIVWGLASVSVGLALDFVLSSVVPGARGRCSLLVTARTGKKLCVGGVDVRKADGLLKRMERPV
jgi:hypothetical protein